MRTFRHQTMRGDAAVEPPPDPIVVVVSDSGPPCYTSQVPNGELIPKEREAPVPDVSGEPFNETMSEDELQEAYDRTTEDHPLSLGKALSCKERDSKGIRASTLVYGEIDFSNFVWAVRQFREKFGKLLTRGGTFYDIGSGTGKAVFAAALAHDFERCVGIEILENLYRASVEMQDKWERDVRATLPEEKQRCHVEFRCADLTLQDFSDARMIFANSTCFSDELMETIAGIADKCQVGTVMMTFTRRLPSEKWRVLEYQVKAMSWGSATVFWHEKVM